ncbi:phosphotransferase [Kutzneria sp. NPDC051319]|uniref:phosphotransferase n=1 Tax=Kutzneria sp. NPDC051319 TaxID=3155047 RepID=UPI0034362D8D
MRLLAKGRDADVFDIGNGRVLRRCRYDGDVAKEAAVMRRLRADGFPVPAVYEASGRDLVMERVPGPSLLAAMSSGDKGVVEAAEIMLALHEKLRGVGILHLDLHPDNILLGPDGPVLIDWTNSAEGPPELDAAVSALILAQVAVGEAALAGLAEGLLREFAPRTDAVAELNRAVEYRRANPTMTERELADLDRAAELVRDVTAGR